MVYDPKQGCVRDLSMSPRSTSLQEREEQLGELYLSLTRLLHEHPGLGSVLNGREPDRQEFIDSLAGLTREEQTKLAENLLRFSFRTLGYDRLITLTINLRPELEPVGKRSADR